MYVSSNARKGLSGYRGMGQGTCPGSPGCPGYAEPEVAVPADVQQQIADLWSYLWEQPTSAPMTQAPSTATSVTQWFNQNAGKLAIGAAAFVGLMLFAKAGR